MSFVAATRCLVVSAVLIHSYLVWARPESQARGQGPCVINAAELLSHRGQFDLERVRGLAQKYHHRYESSVQRALRSLESDSVARAIENEIDLSLIYRVLMNEEAASTADKLGRIILEIKDTRRSLIKAMTDALEESGFSSDEAKARRHEFQQAPSLTSIKRLLGHQSFPEFRQRFVGAGSAGFSGESLIGQYIAQSQAAATLVRFRRGFKAGLNTKGRELFLFDPDSELSDWRLVVPVSARSFPRFKRLVLSENVLLHLHTPAQGTLKLAHRGLVGSYGRLTNPIRMPEQGSFAPAIIFSTQEGQRLTQYFRLAEVSGVAREPWHLPGYCATGGYDSCTHWIGNIPVGDKLVDRYVFPGAMDEHAYNSISRSEARDRAPRNRLLRPYSSEDLAEFDDRSSDHSEDWFEALVRRVWRVPGRQQLAEVLGLQPQNLRGELANPGFVALSLLGPAKSERVPVVFVFVDDHREAIPKHFDWQISAY